MLREEHGSLTPSPLLRNWRHTDRPNGGLIGNLQFQWGKVWGKEKRKVAILESSLESKCGILYGSIRNNYKTMIAGKTDARLIFGFAFQNWLQNENISSNDLKLTIKRNTTSKDFFVRPSVITICSPSAYRYSEHYSCLAHLSKILEILSSAAPP